LAGRALLERRRVPIGGQLARHPEIRWIGWPAWTIRVTLAWTHRLAVRIHDFLLFSNSTLCFILPAC